MSSATKIALSLSAIGLFIYGYKKTEDSPPNRKKLVTIACVLGICTSCIFYKNYSDSKQQNTKIVDKGLSPREYRKYKLIKKINVSHNTRRYRFALQTSNTVLGLPIGKHISFRYFDKDDEIRRPYTPVTCDRQRGYFETVIKVYENGKMSQHLESLVVDKDYIEARGPLGNIYYKAPGLFEIKQKRQLNEYKVKKIGMIAGGTGIAPMLQVISEIIAVSEDKTQVSLIFGNVSIDDILLYDELKEIRNKYNHINIRFIVDKAPTDGRKWDEDVGYITKTILQKQLFPPSDDVIILNCGPPIMVKICTKNLIDLGYDENRIIVY